MLAWQELGRNAAAAPVATHATHLLNAVARNVPQVTRCWSAMRQWTGLGTTGLWAPRAAGGAVRLRSMGCCPSGFSSAEATHHSRHCRCRQRRSISSDTLRVPTPGQAASSLQLLRMRPAGICGRGMPSVPSEPAAHGEAAAARGAWPDQSKACGRKSRAGCSWLGVRGFGGGTAATDGRNRHDYIVILPMVMHACMALLYGTLLPVEYFGV